jgi:hypothetical protein
MVNSLLDLKVLMLNHNGAMLLLLLLVKKPLATLPLPLRVNTLPLFTVSLLKVGSSPLLLLST